MKTLLMLTLILTFTKASADTFDAAITLQTARHLIADHRFRDAELQLLTLHPISRINPLDENTWLDVLDLQAISLANQGNTTEALIVRRQQHRKVASLYHHRGYQFAHSLGNLAEANYRAGRAAEATDLTRKAISILAFLNPPPADTIRQLRKQLIAYRDAPVSPFIPPADLSAFYSHCESLASNMTVATAENLMEPYVEVNVDYVPRGHWRNYFDAIVTSSRASSDEADATRVFIPGINETMRDKLCVLHQKGSRLSSASSVAYSDQ